MTRLQVVHSVYDEWMLNVFWCMFLIYEFQSDLLYLKRQFYQIPVYLSAEDTQHMARNRHFLVKHLSFFLKYVHTIS